MKKTKERAETQVSVPKKKSDKESLGKRIKASFGMTTLILLGMLDTVIVLVPTYLENYLPNIYLYLHLEPAQYTGALGFYGIFMLVMNFVGAYLGGKFKGRTLLITGMFVEIAATLWYATLMFQSDAYAIYVQWIFILLVISFAISGLIWGPLWRIAKNYGTEDLVGKDKEKRVGRNNGIVGTYEALLGIILAGIGALLVAMEQSWHLWDPIVLNNGNELSIAFMCLIVITIIAMIVITILVWIFVKPIDDEENRHFTIKSLGKVLGNWKIWALGFLITGVFMLQMELSAYINYLKNSLMIAVIIVSVFGIIRTYVMRFLLAGWVGRAADKAHSYIFILVTGLFIGIILIIIAACLPGFGGKGTVDLDSLGYSKGLNVFIQVMAVINLIVLGGLTWTLVTIRWSPIGAELGVTNETYSSTVAFLSALGFSPGIYFKFIKKAIEKANTVSIVDPSNADKTISIVTLYGNQMILFTCAGLAAIGVIFGLALYIALYRKSPKYKFRWLMIHKPAIQETQLDQQTIQPQLPYSIEELEKDEQLETETLDPTLEFKNNEIEEPVKKPKKTKK